MSNAIRHTAQGRTIQLMAYPVPEAIVVTVISPGPPIASDHIPRLFDRFYRADRMRSASASSTGRGLAIVHSIMALHGGRADVDCAAGMTTFKPFFPLDSTATHLDRHPEQRQRW